MDDAALNNAIQLEMKSIRTWFENLRDKTRYICFEGVEGVGKSTQIRLVGEHLIKCGYNVLLTKEPGTPWLPLTMTLRGIMLDAQYDSEMTPLAREYISQAIRSIHLEKLIRPTLECQPSADAKGVHVDFILQDRGILSGIAYGIACGNDADFIFDLARRTRGTIPLYDHVIVLDGDFEQCLKRASTSKQEFKAGDVIESKGVEFMATVRELMLTNMDRVTKSHYIADDVHKKSIAQVTDEIIVNIVGLRRDESPEHTISLDD